MTRLLLLIAGQTALLLSTLAVAGTPLQRALHDVPGLQQLSAGALLVHVLQSAAVLAAAWLLAGTLHDVVMAATRPRAQGFAPQWVRRIIDQALGGVLLLGVMAGPATAATVQPSPVVDISEDFSEPALEARGGQRATPPVTSSPPLSPPLLPTTPGPVGSPMPPDQPAVDDGVPAQAGGHVVAAGENLWVIARAALLDSGQTAPTDREVHRFWVQLITANHESIRSGDPNLIYPGEHLVLPRVEVDA